MIVLNADSTVKNLVIYLSIFVLNNFDNNLFAKYNFSQFFSLSSLSCIARYAIYKISLSLNSFNWLALCFSSIIAYKFCKCCSLYYCSILSWFRNFFCTLAVRSSFYVRSVLSIIITSFCFFKNFSYFSISNFLWSYTTLSVFSLDFMFNKTFFCMSASVNNSLIF